MLREREEEGEGNGQSLGEGGVDPPPPLTLMEAWLLKWESATGRTSTGSGTESWHLLSQHQISMKK